ncbi:MAG TPA: type II toxin-antitoxin system VapC family toxin [Bryobacteraceae bacterium]|nr:type II toxin-antitoxin system VapC family toxin [Bryobacteraceae bacterium]
MRVLVDTHSLVWALAAPESLSSKARRILADSEVVASVANLWELLLKAPKKGALLTDPLTWWERHVSGNAIPVLSIRVSHVIALGHLPDIHRDPFDRILIAQALVENLPVVSKDARLGEYKARILW